MKFSICLNRRVFVMEKNAGVYPIPLKWWSLSVDVRFINYNWEMASTNTIRSRCSYKKYSWKFIHLTWSLQLVFSNVILFQTSPVTIRSCPLHKVFVTILVGSKTFDADKSSGHTSLKRRRFNVDSTSKGWLNFESTLFQRWVPAGKSTFHVTLRVVCPLGNLRSMSLRLDILNTVELRWLEPLWDHENLFETAVVRASEGYYQCQTRRHNGDDCGISFRCSIF